jgi:hypothetical protein
MPAEWQAVLDWQPKRWVKREARTDTDALFDAIGVHIRYLPITPEKILAALDRQGRES